MMEHLARAGLGSSSGDPAGTKKPRFSRTLYTSDGDRPLRQRKKSCNAACGGNYCWSQKGASLIGVSEQVAV